MHLICEINRQIIRTGCHCGVLLLWFGKVFEA